MKTKQRNLKQAVLFIGAVGISIFLLFFFITSSWIGYDVKNQCEMAQASYEGDCVEALIQVLASDQRDYRTKNSAIWALGQLGDERALPMLESLYTGEIPERESLDATISQYELKKAIALTSGGPNVTAIFWRYNID